MEKLLVTALYNMGQVIKGETLEVIWEDGKSYAFKTVSGFWDKSLFLIKIE